MTFALLRFDLKATTTATTSNQKKKITDKISDVVKHMNEIYTQMTLSFRDETEYNTWDMGRMKKKL